MRLSVLIHAIKGVGGKKRKKKIEKTLESRYGIRFPERYIYNLYTLNDFNLSSAIQNVLFFLFLFLTNLSFSKMKGNLLFFRIER